MSTGSRRGYGTYVDWLRADLDAINTVLVAYGFQKMEYPGNGEPVTPEVINEAVRFAIKKANMTKIAFAGDIIGQASQAPRLEAYLKVLGYTAQDRKP